MRVLKCRGGEMVDTPALGAGLARGGGSSPLPGTNTKLSATIGAIFVCAGEARHLRVLREDLNATALVAT